MFLKIHICLVFQKVTEKSWVNSSPPPLIAEFMARWVLDNPACQTILDPAVGLGVFFRAILRIKKDANYKLLGYDIDGSILDKAKVLFSTTNQVDIELKNKDYLREAWNEKFDGIICNPPYLKFQDYKNRAASLEKLQRRLKINLSGFTNIYAMFLLKSANQLSAGGRAAYLIPSEFLNSDYGTLVKKHLLDTGSLRFIILFDYNENIFNNALTTSCILLLSKDTAAKSVTFIKVSKAEDLRDVSTDLASYPTDRVNDEAVLQSNIEHTVKWRAYYQRRNGESFKNLVPLSTYGKIVRGIATGDNDYFTFNEEKQEKYKIKDEFLLPCLTKAVHANGNFFTKMSFEQLKSKNSKVVLLNALNTNDEFIRRYIQLGEKLGVNTKYLTSHRKPWYAIEKRPPAPILVSVFNRNKVRFVKNEANISNLTCFHCFYTTMSAVNKEDVLSAYFLTDVSKKVIDDNRREYGNGLNKFEPNDLNKAKVINLEVIDSKSEQQISELYQNYRVSESPALKSEILKNLEDIFVEQLLK